MTSQPPVVWNGTADEASEWFMVMAKNPPHDDKALCPDDCVHRLIATQKGADRLLFMRWCRERLMAQEKMQARLERG